MKKATAATSLMLLALLLATPAPCATNMLTASGATTAPTSSACPVATAGMPKCSSGWFSVKGHKTVVITVWETTGTHTSTVTLYQRMDSTSPVTTLKTWTDPSATQIGVSVYPPAGELLITVSAVQAGGAVKAKIASSSMSGVELW